MRHRLVVGAMVAVLTAGCASAGGPAASVPPSREASAAAVTSSPAASGPGASGPARTLVISRSNSCDFVLHSDSAVGKNEVLVETFTCRYDMSDARVSGTMKAEITTTFEPADSPTAHWVGTFTLTNAGGSWTGTGRGALVLWPEVKGPTNYGIDTYHGQGAYAGLTFTELIAGNDFHVDISGWIDEIG